MTDSGTMRKTPEKNSLTPQSADRGHAYQPDDTWEYTVADDRSGVRLTLASVVTQSGFEAGEKVTVTRLEEGKLLVERQE